jgi:hypothetical protein
MIAKLFMREKILLKVLSAGASAVMAKLKPGDVIGPEMWKIAAACPRASTRKLPQKEAWEIGTSRSYDLRHAA